MNRILLAAAIWAGFAMVCLIGTYAHADDGYTCADVRAVVAIVGEARAEAAARAAGASERQIRDARRCLKSSSR